jgi:Protein of unknown function (DUF1553)
LVGEGFYEPIDDIGPERTPTAPKAVEFLSKSFTENDYDMKWLFRVICATDAYQRESRPRREIDGTPFVANVAQPLRSDQLYSAILTAVDMEESDEPLDRRRRRRPQPQPMPGYGRNATPRTAFEAAFGYDPSDPRESISGSIPQALAMMNGTRMNVAIRAMDRETVLGRLLKDVKENDALVEELYLRTLSREPTDKELASALEYVKTVDYRQTAFEDLFWALLNSSEFSHRR